LTIFAMPVGAFVEPDEEELGRRSSLERMRIFSVGSFANFVTGVAATALLLLLTGGLSGALESDGMRVAGFIDGYAAKDILPAETVIYNIDGIPTSDLGEFRKVTTTMKPGQNVTMNTSAGTFVVPLGETKEAPGKGVVGIYIAPSLKIRGAAGRMLGKRGTAWVFTAAAFMVGALSWIAFFNINVGLVNLLPLIPFDGGRMFKEVVSSLRLSPRNIDLVVYTSIAFIAALFMVNVLPLLKMGVDFVVSLM
jgi:membrane-associated protease RseP (regulator of RpoE activity)